MVGAGISLLSFPSVAAPLEEAALLPSVVVFPGSLTDLGIPKNDFGAVLLSTDEGSLSDLVSPELFCCGLL
jgi:hypothetical protein